MNICLVNNIFPPIETGSSLYTRDLARFLTAKGHHIIVITSGFQSQMMVEEHPEGYTIYRLKSVKLPKLRIWHFFSSFTFNLTRKNIRTIKEIILEENIQIIHQCNNIFDLVFASAHVAKKLKIPLVCSLTTQIQHQDKILNKFLELFDRTIVKHFFVTKVNTFIALDKETLRFINDRYARYTGIELIPFGIPDLSIFQEIKRDYSKNHFWIISLGHVSEMKNRRELISALPLIRKKIRDAKIKIIGELFSNRIKKLVYNNQLEEVVIFTGKIEHNRIPEIIAEADIGSIFCTNIPYPKGVGSANLELMASGLPVIIDAYDDNFGPDFPFKNGIHFVKLESKEPEWLANKIIELFENAEMRERIGKAGKDFVTIQLTWANIIPLIETVYKKAIDQNNE
jgi:glycosyltransferase involved in cell wall biosynthesis